MRKSFVVYKKYLKIPSDYSAESVVAVLTDQEEMLDFIISYSEKGKDYAYIDVKDFIGKAISVDCEKDLIIKQTNYCPFYKQYKNRPMVHYTTPYGHMNDPNGLFYKDGEYHIYYQCHPYSPSSKGNDFWSRQNWAHATTKDFVKFTYHGMPIRYDSNGAAWSGSAIVDRQNVSGYGSKDNPAVLYYWTLAPRQTFVCEQSPYVQILSVSNDNGKTIEHKGVCLPNVKPENRDPKVVFCQELGCYVMALFIEEPNVFGLFRSNNLINWELVQQIKMEDDRECPNFFPLTADDGKVKWVFLTAGGKYLVGDFKKGKYSAGQPIKTTNYSNFTTATQVFDGEENLSISWLHVPYTEGQNFAGALTFPVKYFLKKIGQEYLIHQKPYGIEKLMKKPKVLPDGEQTIDLKDKAYLLDLKLTANGVQHIKINNHVCTVDFDKKILYLNQSQMSFECDKTLSLQILIDRHCVELYAQNGLYNLSECKPHDKKQTLLVLPQTACSVQLTGLKHLKYKKGE
ncbi:MAG: glycoside hydrolase family 32 protein [Clostridia bacterium]|nr:glycoside hydrolase family 32 protein [Clostridia bacterium]